MVGLIHFKWKRYRVSGPSFKTEKNLAYLSTDQLQKMGFKSLGLDVKISDKASIYNADQIEIGDYSRIDDFCVISGRISIGRFVYIAPFCLLAGGEKGIIIDDFSSFSYGCRAFSQSSDYSGMFLVSPSIPAQFKSELIALVEINRHVNIGANSIVFPGIRIAEGCSVGAMTLINKNTKPWGVYVGIPAKRLKDRKKDLLILEKTFLEQLRS